MLITYMPTQRKKWIGIFDACDMAGCSFVELEFGLSHIKTQAH